MKKNVANQIAKLWNDEHAGSTAETRTHAEVKDSCLGYEVRISKEDTNDGASFHHIDSLAAIEAAFKVRSFVSLRDGELVAIIF